MQNELNGAAVEIKWANGRGSVRLNGVVDSTLTHCDRTIDRVLAAHGVAVKVDFDAAFTSRASVSADIVAKIRAAAASSDAAFVMPVCPSESCAAD
jgi:hypothetical protein